MVIPGFVKTGQRVQMYECQKQTNKGTETFQEDIFRSLVRTVCLFAILLVSNPFRFQSADI
jgi:hypothetical protein